MAQGIPFNKEKVLEALEPYFKLGYKIPKACRLAEFNDEVLYDWIKQDPSLLVKINAWQGMLDAKAREAVVQSILGQEEKRGIDGEVIQEFRPPSVKDARWWLERMERESFSTRTELDHTSKGGQITGWSLEIIDKTEDIIDEEEDTGDNSPEEITES